MGLGQPWAVLQGPGSQTRAGASLGHSSDRVVWPHAPWNKLGARLYKQPISIPHTLPTSPPTTAPLGDMSCKLWAPEGPAHPAWVCMPPTWLPASLHPAWLRVPVHPTPGDPAPCTELGSLPRPPWHRCVSRHTVHPADPVPISLALAMLGQRLSTSPATSMGLRCSSQGSKNS